MSGSCFVVRLNRLQTNLPKEILMSEDRKDYHRIHRPAPAEQAPPKQQQQPTEEQDKK